MTCKDVRFSAHAIQQMYQRNIANLEVLIVLESGDVVEDYPEDKPYPSKLLLGYVEQRALHVVAAKDEQSGRCFVITAYEPDPQRWTADFRTRRVKQ